MCRTVSFFAGDQWLAATQVPALRLSLVVLDSFEPEAHQQLSSTVADHGAPIWILLRDRQTDAKLGTVAMLRRLGARRSATLSAKNLVVNDSTCWSDAK